MEYKAAVVLNNMATSMAMQHCYDQAFKTLKDAAILIKAAAQKNPNCELLVASNSVRVQTKLRKAYGCTANPLNSAQFADIKLRSHNSLFKSNECMSSRRAAELLIRIEADDQELLDHEYHIEFSIAVILYNYAILGLCVVMKFDKNKPCRRSTSLRDGAVKLLALSADILSKLYERLLDVKSDDIMTPLVLNMSVTLLSKLVDIFTTTGREVEAQSCASTLSFLVRVAQNEAGGVETLKKGIAAAAA